MDCKQTIRSTIVVRETIAVTVDDTSVVPLTTTSSLSRWTALRLGILNPGIHMTSRNSSHTDRPYDILDISILIRYFLLFISHQNEQALHTAMGRLNARARRNVEVKMGCGPSVVAMGWVSGVCRNHPKLLLSCFGNF